MERLLKSESNVERVYTLIDPAGMIAGYEYELIDRQTGAVTATIRVDQDGNEDQPVPATRPRKPLPRVAWLALGAAATILVEQAARALS